MHSKYYKFYLEWKCSYFLTKECSILVMKALSFINKKKNYKNDEFFIAVHQKFRRSFWISIESLFHSNIMNVFETSRWSYLASARLVFSSQNRPRWQSLLYPIVRYRNRKIIMFCITSISFNTFYTNILLFCCKIPGFHISHKSLDYIKADTASLNDGGAVNDVLIVTIL